MTATREYLLTAWALGATGALVVLALWLREERRQNRYLAALKARDWPEVERLMEFGGSPPRIDEGDPATLARQRRAAYRDGDYWSRFERARDEAAATPA